LLAPGVTAHPWVFSEQNRGLAAAVIEGQSDNSPKLFMDFLGWAKDSTLNGWSGVQFENYRGNSVGQSPAELRPLNSGEFGNRGWYRDTPCDTACAGIDLLPNGAIIVSANLDLLDSLSACSQETAMRLKDGRLLVDYKSGPS